MSMRSEIRCPRCKNRLYYTMKASVDITINATDLVIFHKNACFEETVRCAVCGGGGSALPTKVVEAVKAECRPISKANGLYSCICDKM